MLAVPASRRLVITSLPGHDARADRGVDLGAVFVEYHVADRVQAHGHLLQSAPAARAIQQYASWRTQVIDAVGPADHPGHLWGF